MYVDFVQEIKRSVGKIWLMAHLITVNFGPFAIKHLESQSARCVNHLNDRPTVSLVYISQRSVK